MRGDRGKQRVVVGLVEMQQRIGFFAVPHYVAHAHRTLRLQYLVQGLQLRECRRRFLIIHDFELDRVLCGELLRPFERAARLGTTGIVIDRDHA
jgi:hypothetical protein